MILDPWQESVLKTEGNIAVRAGRQVGKSTIISYKACEYAVNNPKKAVMIIASTERQSYLLFEKVLNFLYEKHRAKIKTGSDRPTKHIIKLKNGSIIYAFPTGLSGYGIRGYTINLLIVDECAFIPDDVFTAVVPMLAVAKGTIWVLSTPHGKEGFFYRCFTDESFAKFHVSSLECPRRDDKFLEREKGRMTKLQFTQEYLGEFIDELRQFFSSDLIKKCCILPKVNLFPLEAKTPQEGLTTLLPPGDYFMGVDVARLGGDQTVLISCARRKDRLKMFGIDISEKTYTTETVQRILIADRKCKYKKIYIDDGGLGVAVFDPLLREDQTKKKVVAINNASRSLDRDGKSKKKILKEDLYNNLLRLMEQGKIELFDDEDLALSLKSVQYEYTDDGNLKIYGNYTHCAEALIRAAWCMSEKQLNIWCR